MNSFLQQANELRQDLQTDRRYFHQNPEVNADLPRATEYVMKRLQEMGYQPQEIAKSAVCATVGDAAKGPTIMLRADMDALPMQEDSGLEFASVNENAHTCGHDMHAAMLLGAARILKDRESELAGCVKLMFQPDEEGLTGAKSMIDAGILENPTVEAAMALHVFPGELPPGAVAYSEGPMMASQDRFVIEIEGHGGHGAMPHLSVDPVNVAAHIHIALQEIVAREISAAEPVVITVGSLQAGTTANIIPQTAVLEGTIRAFSPEVRSLAKQRLVEISQLTAQAFRATCQVTFPVEAPPNINNPQLGSEMLGYIKEMGIHTVSFPKVMGSEDFAYVSERIPTCFLAVGAGGSEEIYNRASSHNPKVVFNEDALPYGAAILAGCAEKWLENHSK